MTDLPSSGSDGGGRPTPIEEPTRVELRQAHLQLRSTLSCLEKAMSEHGVISRASRFLEHDLGTDYWFSDRTHALDLVQFIEGVVPVEKQSDDDGVFSLHILPICRDDLIPGYVVGLRVGFVICTGVSAHGISVMDPSTLQTALLTAEAYWRAPCAVVMSNCKLLTEYLVLDIVTITTDPPVADDDSYCLADAHIVRVSDLGKTHNKLLFRTHLGRLLKPGDYVLGYEVAGILVKKKSAAEPPSSQEPRSVQQRFFLNMEQRILFDTQIFFCQHAITLHQNQQLLGSLATTSNPQAHEKATLFLKEAQHQLTQVLTSCFLHSQRQQSLVLQPSLKPLISQILGSLPTTSNPQAHQLLDDIVDCSGDTPRRSAGLKAKPTESPEGEKPTKRERKSSGKKGKADKKDNEDGENEAIKAAEDAAAAAGAQESTDVEMKDAEGNADKAGKVHAEGNADKAEGEEVSKTVVVGGKEAEEGNEEKEVSMTLEGKEDENADKKMEDSEMLIPISEAKENANADKEKLEDSEALAQAQLIEKESDSADKKTEDSDALLPAYKGKEDGVATAAALPTSISHRDSTRRHRRRLQ